MAIGIDISPANNPIITLAISGIDLPNHDKISLIDQAPIERFINNITITVKHPAFSFFINIFITPNFPSQYF